MGRDEELTRLVVALRPQTWSLAPFLLVRGVKQQAAVTVADSRALGLLRQAPL